MNKANGSEVVNLSDTQEINGMKSFNCGNIRVGSPSGIYAIYNYLGQLYRGVNAPDPGHYPAPSAFVDIATATPPEWHNAPLETGWSWTTQGKYGKDGSGKVYLVGAVNKASAPLSGEAILRLPTGFRPPVLWPVSFSSVKGTDGSSWATYGYLWPDGYLRFSGGALPANYSLNQGIAFAAEFPAV